MPKITSKIASGITKYKRIFRKEFERKKLASKKRKRRMMGHQVTHVTLSAKAKQLRGRIFIWRLKCPPKSPDIC